MNSEERAIKFIEKYIDLIDLNDFINLYKFASTQLQRGTGVMTLKLLDAGINPLEYLTYIPENYLAYTGIKNFNIPSHITSIRHAAFCHTKLDQITIPSSVITIGPEAFASCAELRNIDIQEGCQIIQQGAFYYCGNIQQVKFPNSLQRLYFNLFDYNDFEIEIIYNGTEKEWSNKISKLAEFIHKASVQIIGLDFQKEIVG